MKSNEIRTCHLINIEPDWLFGKMDLYDVYLEDIFEIKILEKKENRTP